MQLAVKTAYAALDAYVPEVLPTFVSTAAGLVGSTSTFQHGSLTQTVSCGTGGTSGTATLTLVDADQSTTTTAGDSASISFNNCPESVGTVSDLQAVLRQ